MRRTAFIILGATAAVVALLLVGAAIAIKTLDPNRFVAPLAARVKAATGRELSVHGPIEYKLSLTPKVVLPDVAFENAPWSKTRQMLTAKRVEAQVALLPLLSRRFDVIEFILVEPVITLETDASGRGNWEFGPPATNTGASSSTASTSANPTAFGIGNFEIRQGTLTYRDGGSGKLTSASIERMSMRARDMSAPIAVDFRGTIDDVPVAVAGDLGPPSQWLAQQWPYSLALKGQVNGNDAKLSTKLAKAGAVVVTVNYRLGALGFLAHPALASRGAAGNYGLMDQQAALRWVQRNIGRFGGDAHNVTIAGESAGGLSVLAHVTSRSSKGLFQRAIVESGAFALEQEPLAKAEASGKEFATKVGCADQSAECLRNVPEQALVDNVDAASATIPGVVDGAVLKESIGTALRAGRFNNVTILNGSNHDEEALFTLGGRVVSRGYNVAYTSPVTADNYESNIASALRVSPAQAAAIAKGYPLSAYPTPDKAFGTLIGDATFACGVDQVNTATGSRVPTYGYEFNDDTAPFLFAPAGLLDVATHGSEMWYLFDLPNAPFPVALNAEQTALADSMRAAWVRFAATGNPSTPSAPWPSYAQQGKVLSLELPAAQVSTDFAARHHCASFAQNLDKVK